MQNPGNPDLISPILKLGWTLNYEMFFYLTFAAVIYVRPVLRTTLLAAFFLALFACTVFVGSLPTQIRFWGNPIVLEFVLGCVVALLYISGMLRNIPRKLLTVIGLAGVIGLIVSGFDASLNFSVTGQIRIIAWGIPAMLVVLAFVGMEQAAESSKKYKRLHFIGDASYSIYLSHLFVVVFMRLVWSRLGLPTDSLWAAIVFVALCFTGGAGFGCLVYLYIERPATAWVKKLLFRKRRVESPSLP